MGKVTPAMVRALKALNAVPHGLLLIPGNRQGITGPTIEKLIVAGLATYDKVACLTKITAAGQAELPQCTCPDYDARDPDDRASAFTVHHSRCPVHGQVYG